jgi:hypothetical protein
MQGALKMEGIRPLRPKKDHPCQRFHTVGRFLCTFQMIISNVRIKHVRIIAAVQFAIVHACGQAFIALSGGSPIAIRALNY